MLHPDARIFSHHASKDPVPPRGTLDRFLLRTEQTGWAVLYLVFVVILYSVSTYVDFCLEAREMQLWT